MFNLFKKPSIPEAFMDVQIHAPKLKLEIFTHKLDADGARRMKKYIEAFPDTFGDIVNTQVINQGNEAYVYVWYIKNYVNKHTGFPI